MPAIATQSAQLYLLTLQLSGGVNAGVLLHLPSTGALYLRLRRDWDQIAPEEAEVLAELQDDLERKSAELGSARLLAQLEDTLSNVLRISEPRDVMVENFERALARLYRQHIQTQPQPFVTHLPRYSVAVAAGKFLDNQEVTQQHWEEAPVGLRLDPRMFVAEIVGQSMEPRIPDGSLCIFRAGAGGSIAGSREGKLVLVEYLGGGTNDRYTVKRYHSEKTQAPDGTWSHQRIRLEPLNPAFDAWDLDPEEDRFRILAEFVQVL
jgi:phage repressor protein C with HTH and peptisase S24 domain